MCVVENERVTEWWEVKPVRHWHMETCFVCVFVYLFRGFREFAGGVRVTWYWRTVICPYPCKTPNPDIDKYSIHTFMYTSVFIPIFDEVFANARLWYWHSQISCRYWMCGVSLLGYAGVSKTLRCLVFLSAQFYCSRGSQNKQISEIIVVKIEKIDVNDSFQLSLILKKFKKSRSW